VTAYDDLNADFEVWATVAMASLGPINILLAKEDGEIPHVYVGTGVELTWGGYASAARDASVDGSDLDAINASFEGWGTIVLAGLATDDVPIEDFFTLVPNSGYTYALPSVQWMWQGWYAGAVS